MIDVSELVDDPDFAEPGGITVTRKAGTFVSGRFTPADTVVNATGTIQPMESKEIAQLPQADQIVGAIKLWSKTELLTARANPDGLADEVVWNGQNWKIWTVRNFGANGHYAYTAVRLSGG